MKKLLLILTCLFSFALAAEPTTDHSQHQHGALPLPEDIRPLIQQEMNELKQAMESLVFLVISAQWLEIEKLATSIENTFIMKKTLSKKQMQQLHSVLPLPFKQYDKAFHGYAGKLAVAAKDHNIELVQFYRYKMNEVCTSCHAAFANHLFTGFNQPVQ